MKKGDGLFYYIWKRAVKGIDKPAHICYYFNKSNHVVVKWLQNRLCEPALKIKGKSGEIPARTGHCNR